MSLPAIIVRLRHCPRVFLSGEAPRSPPTVSFILPIVDMYHTQFATSSLMSTYLSSFFSLPVKRSTGERLNHEEVVHRLDSDTVSYEVALGVNNTFTEAVRVSIKVETGLYDSAIAWLKDLVYSSEFDKERLQVTVAKIAQSLPEMKRDGDTVLGSVSAELLYAESSTSRMGGIVPQMDYIPKLVQRLQESPAEVVKDLEEIRSYREFSRHLFAPSGLTVVLPIVTDPTGVRISVNGDILALKEPRSAWARHFGKALPVRHFVSLALLALGRTAAYPHLSRRYRKANLLPCVSRWTRSALLGRTP